MSFSAEMKDFISAYSTGSKINASRTDQDYKDALTDSTKKKTDRENDPDTLELQDKQARANLARTNAGVGLIGEQMKNAAISRAYTQALTNRVNNPPADPGSGLLPPTGYSPTGPAVGGAPSGLTNTMTDDYAAGGVIPDAAGSDDSEADPELDPDAAGSDDGSGSGAAVGPRALIMRGGRGGRSNIQGLEGVVSPQLIHDAVRGGYQHNIRAFGLGGGVRNARGAAGAKAMAEGQGALTPEEMDAARKAVDPQGKLTDSQRNMAALGSVYQYWANKGEPERAQKVAGQMLQNYRMATQRYAAIAAHAAETGNMDLATKAAVKAYANVPDGRDMQLSVAPDGQIMYHYTDEKGQTINKGLVTPQQLASSAMGLARGGFDKAILSAAGQREEDTKATSAGNKGGGKGLSPKDAETREGMLGPEVEKQGAAWAKKSGSEADPEMMGGIHDAATHLMQQNPDMTPREAVDTAMQLATTKKGNPAADFTTTAQDGTNSIKLANGRTVKMNDDQFDALMTQRAARIKAQQAQEATDAADADKSAKRWQGVKDAGAKIGGAISDYATNDAKKFVDEIPDELKQRGKSAIDAASRAVEDYGKPALAAITDPNINYGTLTTAIGQGVQSALAALQRGTQGSGQAQAAQPQPQGPGAIPSTPDDNPAQYTGTM